MSFDPDSRPTSSDVISVCNLGKSYRIYDSPAARLKQALWRGKRQYFREFWALRHVSFNVKRGESLGIIGRNGSGKSTLLQLICGTLTPAEGTIHTKGRVAALLELGSGFNPEFTGLENVYLNASLLGLGQEETDERLDDILSFADIGDFVNQPVKTYSSGMLVRLAFAVVAHVSADILVVDEALSVGDAIFVQRCMRFIRRMRDERCLLFVSHDAEAVKSLCSHALWLSSGSIQSIGKCQEVALDYLRYCQAVSYGEETSIFPIRGNFQETNSLGPEQSVSSSKINDIVKESFDYATQASLTDNLSQASGWKTGVADLLEILIRPVDPSFDDKILRGGEEIAITIRAIARKSLEQPIIGFILKDRLGQSLFGENTLVINNGLASEKAEAGDELRATFRLLFPMLPSGTYTLMASIANGDLMSNEQHHWLEDAVIVTVNHSGVRHGLVGAFISRVELTVAGK
jgi:lipopolysaccharide transport system ATP-binding protein